MQHKLVRLIFLLLVSSVLAVGCSSNDEPEATDPPEENEHENNAGNNNEPDENNNENETNHKNNTNNNANNNQNGPNSENDDVDDNGTTNDENDTSSVDLPDKIEIDERIVHPNGTMFTLEDISFEEDFTTVNFHVHNGYTYAVKLADWISGTMKPGVTLTDDTGIEYPYMKTSGNPRLIVKSGEKMNASLNFIGKIDDDATSITLVFNPEGSTDDERTDEPSFEFEDIDLVR